jgi:hypothetical protein
MGSNVGYENGYLSRSGDPTCHRKNYWNNVFGHRVRREIGEDNAVFGLNLKKSAPKSDCSGLLELTLEGNDLDLALCSRDHQHTACLDTVEGGDDGGVIRFTVDSYSPQKSTVTRAPVADRTASKSSALSMEVIAEDSDPFVLGSSPGTPAKQ